MADLVSFKPSIAGDHRDGRSGSRCAPGREREESNRSCGTNGTPPRTNVWSAPDRLWCNDGRTAALRCRRPLPLTVSASDAWLPDGSRNGTLPTSDRAAHGGTGHTRCATAAHARLVDGRCGRGTHPRAERASGCGANGKCGGTAADQCGWCVGNGEPARYRHALADMAYTTERSLDPLWGLDCRSAPSGSRSAPLPWSSRLWRGRGSESLGSSGGSSCRRYAPPTAGRDTYNRCARAIRTPTIAPERLHQPHQTQSYLAAAGHHSWCYVHHRGRSAIALVSLLDDGWWLPSGGGGRSDQLCL